MGKYEIDFPSVFSLAFLSRPPLFPLALHTRCKLILAQYNVTSRTFDKGSLRSRRLSNDKQQTSPIKGI